MICTKSSPNTHPSSLATLLPQDTDDIVEELGEVELSPLLDGGDDLGQHLLLPRPLVLDQHQQLPQGMVVLGVGQDDILSEGVTKEACVNKGGMETQTGHVLQVMMI